MQFIKDRLFGPELPTTLPAPPPPDQNIALRDRQPQSTATARIENGTVYISPAIIQIEDRHNGQSRNQSRPQRPARMRSANHSTVDEKSGDTYGKGRNAKLSPSESFHSSSSTIVASPQHGITNPAFMGSGNNLSSSDGTGQRRERPTTVIRQQYWSWSCLCLCSNWTRREKILALIVFFLILVVTGLGSGIGFLYDRNQKLELQL